MTMRGSGFRENKDNDVDSREGGGPGTHSAIPTNTVAGRCRADDTNIRWETLPEVCLWRLSLFRQGDGVELAATDRSLFSSPLDRVQNEVHELAKEQYQD